MKKKIENYATCHPEFISGSDPSAQGARCRNEASKLRVGMTWGFTLAEVLITLGIIGVVAALTMPALTASYQKKVMVTRLQKFYSVMMQVENLKRAQDGALDCSMLTAGQNPDMMLEFIEKNYAPYLNAVKIKKLTKGVAVAFPDGSGMYMAKIGTPTAAKNGLCADTRNIYCINYKDCENVTENLSYGYAGALEDENPRSIFEFYNGTDRGYQFSFFDNGALIQKNGWQIPDDYPW